MNLCHVSLFLKGLDAHHELLHLWMMPLPLQPWHNGCHICATLLWPKQPKTAVRPLEPSEGTLGLELYIFLQIVSCFLYCFSNYLKNEPSSYLRVFREQVDDSNQTQIVLFFIIMYKSNYPTEYALLSRINHAKFCTFSILLHTWDTGE